MPDVGEALQHVKILVRQAGVDAAGELADLIRELEYLAADVFRLTCRRRGKGRGQNEPRLIGAVWGARQPPERTRWTRGSGNNRAR